MKLTKKRTYKLDALPSGSLFLFGDTLCLKTEYRTENGAIEAYIVDSGEMFWGGTNNSFDQTQLVVTEVCFSNSDTTIDPNIPYVPFPIAFHTVDVIATRINEFGRVQILLGRKPKQDKWQFIGGFVEPTHTAEHTASKEFNEEACLLIDETRFKYIGSAFVNDPRYANSCHKITTSLFTVRLTSTESTLVKGGDDIEVVKWFDVEDVFHNLRDLHLELLIKYLIKFG